MCSSSAVTALVPKSNIRVGWPREIKSFPCILITQIAGSDIGYLGYRSAVAGSRVRKELITFQIDIYSKNTRKDTYDISDVISPLLMVSGGCRKDRDVDMYNDELMTYWKSQAYTFMIFHDD